MLQDKARFEAYYTYENDENLRGHSDNQGIIEFLTTERYMKRVIAPRSKILDACAGCGAYAFFLARIGHDVTAGDYTAHNVSRLRERQAEEPILRHIYEGSATDLSAFADGSFDVVLNMGAYYHITDKPEREKTISECLRVLKRGGLFFLAYLNMFSNIVTYHEQWGDFSCVERLVARGHMDDDSLFYQSTPEEIEDVADNFGLTILHHIATDGLNGPVAATLNAMDEHTFARYMEYHYGICEKKSLLGYSEHALAICVK